jgi:CRISPR/Cas system CMR-associated protein Cmr1 (group 7 of RAMP superfamily)
MKILDWIKCKLGYHDYLVVKNLSIRCQKISCSRCKKLWAVNHEMRAILPWDYELECLYKMLEEQVESEVDKRTERIENDTKILLNTIYQDFEKQKEQIAKDAFEAAKKLCYEISHEEADRLLPAQSIAGDWAAETAIGIYTKIDKITFEDYKKSKGDNV